MFAQESAPGGFPIYRIDRDSWHAGFGEQEQAKATQVLEGGGLILLPRLAFPLDEAERRLLTPECVQPRSKHVSFDPRSGLVRGTRIAGGPSGALQRMLGRYAGHSSMLIGSLLPHYGRTLQIARTSFRPFEAAERVSSWRKDDRRLHVDAFPSSPNQGRRLLRVFSNVNPDGRSRVWNVGEPFEAVARRFLPAIQRGWPGAAPVLRALRITRGLRTEYDRIMLQLHDRMKADADYQASAIRAQLQLPAGSTWIVQTDVVSHAALSGQFMFEQTFLLPVEGMCEPERAPLRILERLAGRPLA